jgi:hypothetical protein
MEYQNLQHRHQCLRQENVELSSQHATLKTRLAALDDRLYRMYDELREAALSQRQESDEGDDEGDYEEKKETDRPDTIE